MKWGTLILRQWRENNILAPEREMAPTPEGRNVNNLCFSELPLEPFHKGKFPDFVLQKCCKSFKLNWPLEVPSSLPHPPPGICDHDLITIFLNLTEKSIGKSISYISHLVHLSTHVDLFPTSMLKAFPQSHEVNSSQLVAQTNGTGFPQAVPPNIIETSSHLTELGILRSID